MYTRKLPGDAFRFYVYTNLPHLYTWQGISERMETLSSCRGGNGNDDTTREEFVAHYCDWASSVCTPRNHTRSCQYSNGRHNQNADTVLSKLFTEYTGSMRTYHPEEADLYIVPFPAACWACASRMSKPANPRVDWSFFPSEILAKLEWYTPLSE